jgi:hypothetical protein
VERVRPRQRLGDEAVDVLRAIGEGFGDRTDYVRLGAHVDSRGVGELGTTSRGIEPIQCRVGGRRVLQQNVGPPEGQLQPRPGRDELRWQLVDDAEQRGHFCLFEQPGLVLLDEVDSQTGVA